MKFSNLIILSSALCFPLLAHAQQPAKKDSVALNRELTLEKEYNPILHDASKINTLPEVKEPEAIKAKVEYANFNLPLEVNSQLTPLKAGSYFTDLQSSKKRGYLDLGVGTFIDIDGDLGYQILNSGTDQLSIFGSHRSSNGNVQYLQEDIKQKMKINDNLGGLNYLHDFGNLKLNLNTKYTYSGFNYFGYTLPDFSSSSMPMPEIDKSPNQVNNLFEINAGVSSAKDNELNYMLNLGFTSFGQKYSNTKEISGPKENKFLANWDVSKDFKSDMALGLGGYLKSYTYSLPENGLFLDYKNHVNLSLNPYFKMSGDNWDTRLGVKLHLCFGTSSYTNYAPDIRFNFRPSERVLLYLNAGGGVTDNGNYDLYYENRYVNPLFRVKDSKSIFDGVLGVKTSITSNLWLDVFAGYKTAKREHFYVQAFPFGDPSGTYFAGNMSAPWLMDANTFKVGGNLKYAYQDLFDISLKATYYNWNVSQDKDANYSFTLYAWNKPTFETDLTAGYNLGIIPLRLDMIYHLEAGRKTLEPASSVVNMKNINDLSVKGTYSFNDTFSAFFKLNNLLFQEYDLWYGYPAQNFSIMGGINIRF